jgi:hypothetical protein
MMSHGSVLPGRMIPENHDMASAERSSRGFSALSVSSRTYSISSMLGHFNVSANIWRASFCLFLVVRSKLKVL